ncbi:MAG: non-canonical purine NTP pyrophosphatase, partial [Bacilli bacterium]|nr:non-canonical purine NTP pyrophosphatase [Bacilli bacterium]
YTFEGKAFGKIVDNICGTDGFGYDPIFYSNDLRKTFGEATAKEKSLVSHRGKALRKMVSFLNEHHQK